VPQEFFMTTQPVQSRQLPPSDEADSLFTPRFLLIVAVQLCFGLGFASFFLLPKYLTTEFGASPAVIGLVVATATIANVLSVPFVGAWIDRASRARLLLAGCAASALSALGFMVVHDVGPVIYALRVLQGVGFTLTFNTAGTLVVDQAPARKLGQALGLFGSALLCTNAIGPAIAEPLAARVGWHAVFAFAALSAVVAGGLTLLVKDDRDHERVERRAPSAWRATPRLFWIFAIIATGGAALGVMFTFSQPFALAVGIRRVSGFFVAYTLAAIFVRVAAGNLADRIGRQRVATLALAAYSVAVFSTAWLRPGLLELCGAGLGLSQGLFYPALNALALERVAREHQGRVMAFFNGAFNGGFALSVLGAGVIATHASYPAVFVVVGSVTALGALALARLPS
jgi:MFS family permease